MATEVVVSAPEVVQALMWAEDIPAGQYFRGEMPGGWKGLFLRHYSGIVDVASPSHTWGSPMSFPVIDYSPVKKITIIVE